MMRQGYTTYSIVVCLVFCVLGLTTLATPGQAQTLSGYWPFNDGSGTQALDVSGGGHNAQLHNGVAWTTGVYGGAVSANGSNQYLSIPAINLTSTRSITVMGWFNRTYSTAGGHTLFENSPNYSTSTTGFAVFPDDNTCAGIQAALRGNVGSTINCYSQPSSGVWHHLAFVFDKTQSGAAEVQVYLDGVLQTPKSTPSASNNTNYFGNNASYVFSRAGSSQFTAGTIDDLRIYNSALTTTQVQQIYSMTLSSIAVTPANISIDKGLKSQYTATATYSDGSNQNLTKYVAWSSSSPSIASINSTGLATGLATGSTTIQAVSGSTTGSTGLTVAPPGLVSIKVTPANASIAKGKTQQYTATGTYTDGSTQNLTSTATWSSSSTMVATINSTGLATAAATGTTTIQATSGSISGSTGLTVTAPTLVSIAVTPANASIAKGTTQQYTATGTYTDGSTQNLTSTATWTSSSTKVATINGTGLATAVATGSTTIKALSGAISGSTGLTVTLPTLVSIAVTPASASIAKGTTQQYTATGTYTDGSTQNLTSTATWTSSSTGVATISSTGLATAIATGSTTIQATSGTVTGSVGLTVTPPPLVSIAVTPANASIAKGTTQQYTATGTYGDGSTQNLTSTATWTSSSTGVATISSTGLATAIAAGSTTIQATSGSVIGSATLTATAPTVVSIAVTPANASIAKGTTQQYTATGTYTDGSTQNLTGTATWASSSTGVATISSTGLATAIATGSASIQATSGSVSGSATLTVTPPALVSIALSPANASIAKGTTQQYMATGTYTDGSTQNLTASATWTSSGTAVATINSTGLATAVATGSTTIQATSGSISGSATLSVTPPALVSIALTPANASIAAGTTQQFTATGTYTDGSTQNLTASATWTSSGTAVATINSTGLATAVANGSTTIQASSGSISGSATLTVTPPALVSIALIPANASIAKGTTQQYTATGTYTDGSTQNLTSAATWASSSTGVATINSTGLATAVAAGTTTIQATSGSISGSATLTVTGPALVSIALTPANVSIAKGTTQQYTATGTYTDGSTQNLTSAATWASSSTGVATINSTGLATTVAAGTTTIQAISGSISGSTGLTVTSAALVSLAVTPIGPSIGNGTTQQFTAMGTYTDGSMQNLTSTATWASTNATVATVTSTGLATALATGSTTIQATSGTITGSTDLTVTAATLVSIALAPGNASVGVGATQQFTAAGTYTDGSTQNLTSTATWASTNATVAAVNSAGLATAAATGSTTIQATSGTITGSANLTVAAATLVSIAVSPANTSIGVGANQQFIATGTYSDGSTQNLTSTATWTSTTPAVATINSAGLATAAATGSTNVQATSGTITGSTNLTVLQPVMGLTGDWKFDDGSGTTAADSSGNGHTANLVNGVSWVTGEIGDAVSANGTNQYVAIPTIDLSTTNAVTVTMWVNRTYSTSGGHTLFENTANYNSSTSGFGLFPDDASCQGISAAVKGDVGFNVNCYAQPSSGVWHHLAVVYNKSQAGTNVVKLYIDGILQTPVSSPYSNNNTNNFGNNPSFVFSRGGTSEFNAGMVDELHIYNRALAAGDVLEIYNYSPLSLALTPASASLVVGTSQQYFATRTYSDGSTQDVSTSATWTSSNTAVATVSSTGLVTGVSTGTATIQSTLGTLDDSATLTVIPVPTLVSVAVTPANASVGSNSTLQFTASGTYSDGSTQNLTNFVTWASSNTAVATISSTGLATAVATGSTSIQATSGSMTGSTGLTVTPPPTLVSIAVTPVNASIATGATLQFTATGTYSDGSTESLINSVTWSSTNNAAATMSGSGLATAVSAGSTTIQATSGAVTGSTGLTVTPPTSSFVQFTAGDSGSSAFSTTYLNNVQTGDLIVLFSHWDNQAITATASDNMGNVYVPISGPVNVGAASRFQAWYAKNVHGGNLGFKITYSGQTTSISLVDAAEYSGLDQSAPLDVFSTATGTGTSQGSGLTASTSARYETVVGLFGFDAYAAPYARGIGYAFRDYDASTFLEDKSVNAIGSYQATATSHASASWVAYAICFKNAAQGPATLVSIAVTPANVSLGIGASQQYTATGTFSDGSTQNLTGSVAWSSSNTAAATISSTGQVTAIATGSTTIQATSGTISGSTGLTVTTPPLLVSIAVTAANAALGIGASQQYTATGTFSDGSTQNLTGSVAWSSSNAAAATISSTGQVTAVATGSTTIQATSGTITGSTGLTVTTPPALVSIAVTPANLTVVNGGTQQFSASGNYSDGSTHNLTNSVTWTSTNPVVVTIAGGGLATAVSAGTVSIQATSGSITGSASLSVATGVFPWIPYDMWIDFEQDTLGTEMLPTELAASTHGASGTWSVVDPNALLTTQTFAEDTGHAVTGDTGTHGMACNLNNGNAAYIEWDLPSAQSSLSIGLWYKTGQAVPWSGGPLLIRFYNQSYGPLIRLSDERSPYTNARQIQVSPLNQFVTGITDNTWYWITIKWMQNGPGTLSVYDTSLNLVGTANFTDTFNAPVQAFQLGNPNGSVAEPGASSYFDDLIVDYTHGNFPLLPKIPASINLGLNPATVTNGNTSTGTVTLSAAAPSGGATITLNSSNPTVANVPPTLTIPGGMTSATFTVGTGGVTFSTAVTISATYRSLTASANLTVLPATMSQVANDNFNRSNAPTLGASWTPLLGTNNGALQIVGSQVYSAALSPAIGKEMYYGGLTWEPDQYSEVQVVAASGNGYTGPAVRMTSNDTHYACVVFNTGVGNAVVSIFLDVAGNYSTLAGSTTSTVNPGDTVRCSVQGNVITMTDQTTSSTLVTVADNTISSGYPGLVNAAGSISLTSYVTANWAAGDIAAPMALQQVASDNFNRPDALNLGPNWHVGTGHGPIQIVSQQVQPYPGGGPQPSKEHYVAAAPFPNDQWAQTQIVVEDLLGDNGVELRASDTSDTLYVADVNLTGGPGVAETRIASVINGMITPLVIDTTWSAVNPGDYIRGQVQGNLISLIDVTTGALLLTVTDSNVTSGYAGISMQVLSGGTPDHIAANWSAGTFH